MYLSAKDVTEQRRCGNSGETDMTLVEDTDVTSVVVDPRVYWEMFGSTPYCYRLSLRAAPESVGNKHTASESN